MTISVDPRAGSAELIPLLRRILTPKLVVKKQLNSGDVAWTGTDDTRYGVEVKHLGDILQCIQTGRFVSQLRRMQADYDRYWLLVVDEFHALSTGEIEFKKMYGRVARWLTPFANRRNPVDYLALTGWLTTMELPGGCQLWTVPNDQQAAWWLVGKYKWSHKKPGQHKSLDVFDTSRPAPRKKGGVRFIGKPNEVARVANALVDGIGWDRAKKLGFYFQSVEDFIRADMSELMVVKGIGQELASRIVAARVKEIKKPTKKSTKKKGQNK